MIAESHMNEDRAKWREFAITVVKTMARSTGDTVANTVQRKKSQANILGRLTREFPQANVDELRDLLKALAEELPADPKAHIVPVKSFRPPARGREPESSPKWDERIQLLLLPVLDAPRTFDEVLSKMLRENDWQESQKNFVTSILAAAESRFLIEYHPPFWVRFLGEKNNFWTQPGRLTVSTVTQQIEDQALECEERTDHKEGFVYVIRLDTKDVIERRPLK